MSADSYAQSGRRKRQKALASGAQVPKHRSSKDTKRWCKGVPGREHEWIWQEWKHSRSLGYDPCESVLTCKHCRRTGELARYYGLAKGTRRTRWLHQFKLCGPAF